jgi:hypothetical protein
VTWLVYLVPTILLRIMAPVLDHITDREVLVKEFLVLEGVGTVVFGMAGAL